MNPNLAQQQADAIKARRTTEGTIHGLDGWIAQRTDRCAAGYAPAQHPGACQCGADDEWAIFRRALSQAVDSDGVVRQGAVRPLIRSIPPRKVGPCYARAKREGLLVEVGREQSTDLAGKNGHHWSPVYELRSAA